LQNDQGKLILGSRNYELTNHLGNVLAVISDKKILLDSLFQADVVSANDYYPFGMTIESRSFSSEEYRFGFNGQERDTEININIHHAEFWKYDARTARRWNTDSVFVPFESPYATFRSNPILMADPHGDCPDCPDNDEVGDGGTMEGVEVTAKIGNWFQRFWWNLTGQVGKEMDANVSHNPLFRNVQLNGTNKNHYISYGYGQKPDNTYMNELQRVVGTTVGATLGASTFGIWGPTVFGGDAGSLAIGGVDAFYNVSQHGLQGFLYMDAGDPMINTSMATLFEKSLIRLGNKHALGKAILFSSLFRANFDTSLKGGLQSKLGTSSTFNDVANFGIEATINVGFGEAGRYVNGLNLGNKVVQARMNVNSTYTAHQNWKQASSKTVLGSIVDYTIPRTTWVRSYFSSTYWDLYSARATLQTTQFNESIGQIFLPGANQGFNKATKLNVKLK